MAKRSKKGLCACTGARTALSCNLQKAFANSTKLSWVSYNCFAVSYMKKHKMALDTLSQASYITVAKQFGDIYGGFCFMRLDFVTCVWLRLTRSIERRLRDARRYQRERKHLADREMIWSGIGCRCSTQRCRDARSKRPRARTLRNGLTSKSLQKNHMCCHLQCDCIAYIGKYL